MVTGTVLLMQDLADCKVQKFTIVGILSDIPLFRYKLQTKENST